LNVGVGNEGVGHEEEGAGQEAEEECKLGDWGGSENEYGAGKQRLEVIFEMSVLESLLRLEKSLEEIMLRLLVWSLILLDALPWAAVSAREAGSLADFLGVLTKERPWDTFSLFALSCLSWKSLALVGLRPKELLSWKNLRFVGVFIKAGGEERGVFVDTFSSWSSTTRRG